MNTLRSAIVAALLPLGACVTPTENCAPPRDLVGTWRYSATQDSPSRASIAGSLRVDTQSCRDFSGQLDVVETSANGQVRRLAGPVSGRFADASTVRFDAVLAGDEREHIGRIAGGTLDGTWLVVAAGGSATGGYALRRE